MHVFDCKGVANIVGGSIIHHLVLSCQALGRTQALRLLEINRRMALWQQGRPGASRMAPLRLSNLQSDGWSSLCGPTVKAANTRGLAPFFVLLAEEFCDSGSEFGRLVQRNARCLQHIYNIFYGGGIFLTDEEQADLRRNLLRFGAS